MYLQTIIVGAEGDESKPNVVLVHGFAGSGSLFVKMFEPLAKHVRLILVDMPGMGSSDHPDDFQQSCSSLEASVDYFV